MKQITENLKTPEEKIKAIYEYLQNKTRYVSIQLGIGGFQPFEAAVVDEMGYGDCKALSNYMVSMLDVVGIKSNYTLIRAGKDAPKMNVNFSKFTVQSWPSFCSNHADTNWLECTSQTNPFWVYGNVYGWSRALAITDQGAKIVMTPKYSAEQNVQSRTAEVVVDAKGNARAKIKTTYSGLQYENGSLNFILNDQYDEQKKWIEKTTAIPSFDIIPSPWQPRRGRIPSANVDLDLNLKPARYREWKAIISYAQSHEPNPPSCRKKWRIESQTLYGKWPTPTSIRFGSMYRRKSIPNSFRSPPT